MSDETLEPAAVADRLRFSLEHVQNLIEWGELEAAAVADDPKQRVYLRSVAAFEERREAARRAADAHSRRLDELGAPPE